jgi:hypothetical protein
MAYPDAFVDLVDEEASEPVKQFCNRPCELASLFVQKQRQIRTRGQGLAIVGPKRFS